VDLNARRGADGDADLDVARGDHRDEGGAVGGIGEADGHVGVRDPEPPDEGGERVDRERRKGREIEVPGSDAGDGLHGGARGLDVAERLAGRADQCLARRGEHQPAADPVEQQCAQLGLELAHGLRHRGLRHVPGLGGPGHAALVDHREEEGEPAEIHKNSLYIGTYPRLGLLQRAPALC